jgi:hypothetical protein
MVALRHLSRSGCGGGTACDKRKQYAGSDDTDPRQGESAAR